MLEVSKLQKVIKNRPVLILLPGKSIEQWTGTDKDMCWTTVNDFWVMEEKFKHNMDIVFRAAKECNIPSDKDIDFLSRHEDNLLITEKVSFHHSLDKTVAQFGEKILFFHADRSQQALRQPSPQTPDNFFASASFTALLQMAVIGGAEKVYLIGADGGGDYIDKWDSDSQARLNYDTGIINQAIPILLNNACQTYKVKPIPIYNCSPNSLYTSFRPGRLP